MLRTLKTAMMTLGFMVLSTGTVYAAECTITTTDVGVLHGSGGDKLSAESAAREQCFDRQMAKFRDLHQVLIVDDESGLLIIDHCANLACDKPKK